MIMCQGHTPPAGGLQQHETVYILTTTAETFLAVVNRSLVLVCGNPAALGHGHCPESMRYAKGLWALNTSAHAAPGGSRLSLLGSPATDLTQRYLRLPCVVLDYVDSEEIMVVAWPYQSVLETDVR